MTKNQLKVLATIPKVIEALEALAEEQAEFRRLMGRVGGGPMSGLTGSPEGQIAPHPEPNRATIAPRSNRMANLMTSNPDRFRPPEQESERQKEQREYLELMKNSAERTSRMKQFEGDAPEPDMEEPS